MSDVIESEVFPEHEFNQYLSFVDLERHPDWESAWKSQDRDKVEKILYAMGCDIDNGWEIEVNSHRTRTTNQIEYGPRFVFKERVDPVWQKTGMSVDDIARNSTDVDMRIDLMTMNNVGSTTESLINHIKK